MTLEEKLTARLRALCANTFCDFAPTDTPRPYAVYQQIGGDAVVFVDKTPPSKENAVMQISVWADSRKAAKALILAIEVDLIGATEFQASPVAAAASDFDADMRRYCLRQDFSIWADR